MKTCAAAVVLLLVVSTCALPQERFRTGIFLHHSTGYRIWGPNESSTSMPAEIDSFNRAHAFMADTAFTFLEQHWPPTPDNEWSRWHAIFANKEPGADIRPLLAAAKIIMIKSCFPSSQLWGGDGTARDTSTPEVKSIANYKWHWRSIAGAMRTMPGNFFVIWTNAPLAPGITSSEQAALSDRFCHWAKDTLAAGLDPVFGAFPKNILVFDIFHLLAGADGKLLLKYAVDSLDSHPNRAATERAAPVLVRETLTGALLYERNQPAGATSAARAAPRIPPAFELAQNFPNPFNPSTVIEYGVPERSRVRLRIFNVLGQVVGDVVDEEKPAGWHRAAWNANVPTGMYFYRMEAASLGTTPRRFTHVRPMLLLR